MYAAQVDHGTVTDVIVGTADWANANLGGTWIGSDTKLGPGWTWDGSTFTPPPEPEPQPETD